MGILRGAIGITAMKTYSKRFKTKMVTRMTGSRAVSATELAREVHVPQPTLSRWLRESGTLPEMSSDETSPSAPKTPPAMPDPPAAHRVRSPEEKLRLVALAATLAESELGAMLRREGLHAADLETWRAEMLAALTPRAKVAADPASARPEDRRRIQQLEREIERKDKALAEAAALLILQKKVRDYLGEEDDTTKPGRGR